MFRLNPESVSQILFSHLLLKSGIYFACDNGLLFLFRIFRGLCCRCLGVFGTVCTILF